MSTTVKIDEETKKELDKIQAKILLKSGHKLTQQELLKKIIKFILKKEDEFFSNFIIDWTPMKDEEWEQLKSFITDFGFKTTEETIDSELYGIENDTH